jgi:hypothetical protein
MTRQPADRAFLLDDVSSMFHLWLAKVDEADGSDIAQTFLSCPLGSIVLDKLQSAGGGTGENRDELVVVDLGRWSGLCPGKYKTSQ